MSLDFNMDWLGFLMFWLTSWEAKTLSEHVASCAAGFLGACLYIVVTSPSIDMPFFDKKEGELRLNVLGTLLVGVIVALVVDFSFPVGVVVAFVAPDMLTFVLRRAIPFFGKKFIKDNGGDEADATK